MQVQLKNIGRRFNQEWIFRGIDTQFSSTSSYAVLGSNGSGKSTLLQLISGQLSPSQGEIVYTVNNRVVAGSEIFQHLTIVAPYLELIEEMTLIEMLHFHFQFKELHSKIGHINEILSILDLERHAHKELKYFSSGMKQRVKLSLACCSNSPLLLLDEPCMNLDSNGVSWYHHLVQEYAQERLVMVFSNQGTEYNFCKEQLNIQDFKVFLK